MIDWHLVRDKLKARRCMAKQADWKEREGSDWLRNITLKGWETVRWGVGGERKREVCVYLRTVDRHGFIQLWLIVLWFKCQLGLRLEFLCTVKISSKQLHVIIHLSNKNTGLYSYLSMFNRYSWSYFSKISPSFLICSHFNLGGFVRPVCCNLKTSPYLPVVLVNSESYTFPQHQFHQHNILTTQHSTLLSQFFHNKRFTAAPRV